MFSNYFSNLWIVEWLKSDYILQAFLVQIMPLSNDVLMNYLNVFFYDTFPSEKFDLNLLVLHYFY